MIANLDPSFPTCFLTSVSNHVRYQEYIGPVPPLLPPPDAQNVAEGIIQNQTMPIRALLELRPETNVVCFTTLNLTMRSKKSNIQNLLQQLKEFVIEGVITSIDESQGWYFNRCRTCQFKIAPGWPHRHCNPPGIQQAPNYT